MPVLHAPHRGPMVCVGCGCTDDRACVDLLTGAPCYWVEPGLCSMCGCALPGPNLTPAKLRADYELLMASARAGGDGDLAR